MATKTPGRPSGSRNKTLEHAAGDLTRCPKCSSTQRTAYINRNEQFRPGVDGQGRPYTHIVRRRTACLDCGQHRIDRHFENRPRKQ